MRELTPEFKKELNAKFNQKRSERIKTQLKEFDPRVFQGFEALLKTKKSAEDYPRSCYLHGNVGAGKTTTLMFYAYESQRLGFINRTPIGSFVILTVSQFYKEIKATYHKESVFDEADVVRKYENIGLLVFDDFGTKALNDWSYTLLYDLINYRHAHFKPTMYSSNFSLEQLAEQLNDGRLPDRIAGDCGDHIYNFNGNSKR